MKVLEIKNNLVKIEYDVKDNLALSNFVIIEDTNTPYVAQVVNIKADATKNFAIVKLLFTFNEDGILKNYNGTIPSTKARVSILPSNELLDIIPIEDPIILGELAQQNIQLKVDKTIFDNNLLICSNNLENTSTLLNNIIKQFKNKVVIFDTDGQFDWENKLYFGKDFKLPLNYDTINFIYDTELEDVDATSKAIIQDIFIEVQEYTKTLPEGYLPFETFLNVVDQQYKETKITELVLLKNKLLKYRDLQVFAETLKDVLNLSIAIEKSDIAVIDISDMPYLLQKEIMTYTYDIMYSIKSDIYSFVKIDNNNTDKKLLKKFLGRSNIYTTLICSHDYKYLQEIKEAAQNLILFAPLTLQHDFASYNTFLNKLNQDEFIVYGAHTQNIPLIVELNEIDLSENETSTDEENTNTNEEIIKNDSNIIPMPQIQEEDTENNEQESNTEVIENNSAENIDTNNKININQIPEVEYPDITINETPVEQNDTSTDNTEIVAIDESIHIDNTLPPVDNVLETQEIVEEPNIIEDVNSDKLIIETPEKSSNDSTNNQEENSIEFFNQENDIENINEEEIEPQIDIQEPEIDYSVEDTDIEENFGEPQIIEPNDELVEKVAKDVDKVFYEKLPDENYELPDNDNPETDELTEDDLNLIDDLSVDDNNIQLEDFQDSENSQQTPVVPIYETDDLEPNINQTLEPGDKVSTPKYGEGIVERMIKYGNKMLCSIEFPNIGRRLLDPAMSEITKLD